jgi:hypothetical protein
MLAWKKNGVPRSKKQSQIRNARLKGKHLVKSVRALGDIAES